MTTKKTKDMKAKAKKAELEAAEAELGELEEEYRKAEGRLQRAAQKTNAMIPSGEEFIDAKEDRRAAWVRSNEAEMEVREARKRVEALREEQAKLEAAS